VRIVLAIKGLEDAAGGAERVVSVLLSGLLARGHEVRLVTLDRPGAPSFYPLPDAVVWRQLGTTGVTRKQTLSSFIRSMLALRRTVRAERPDVVVGFMHSMFVPLAFALMATRIPFVASEHIVPEFYENRRLEYLLLILASLRAQKVTALSEAIAARYPRPVRRRMVAIPNPVEPACTEPGRPDDTTQTPYLLTIGRMDPQKDQQTLLRAFARVRQRFPDLRLRIVGDGELRYDLQTLAQWLAIDHAVEMPGRVRETDAEYARALLFVLPSRFESFGMVAAEALARKLPVVAFADCPGVTEIVADDVNGVLVAGTPRANALAEAIDDLLCDRQRLTRLAMAGPASVERFYPEAVITRWESLLAGLTVANRA
jgi:glycosyltransferase involved in cell wall biosynthesis